MATRPVVVPGVLLGIGLGGFVDGILLHQILQWHHMLSATEEYPTTTLAGLEANTVGDGLFHAGAWVAVVVGVVLVWRRRVDGPLPWRQLIGLGLAGWGTFNLVEGVIDHHLLGIHHVRQGAGQLAYDVGFLVFGAVLVVVGWAVYRRSVRTA